MHALGQKPLRADNGICVLTGTAPLKKQAELFFPPEFADDFPVAMQISEKYGLVYVITKLGLLFVYDLQTATAVYRNRISPDPIFLTASSASTGGFYAINRYTLYSVSVAMATSHANLSQAPTCMRKISCSWPS